MHILQNNPITGGGWGVNQNQPYDLQNGLQTLQFIPLYPLSQAHSVSVILKLGWGLEVHPTGTLLFLTARLSSQKCSMKFYGGASNVVLRIDNVSYSGR